MGKDYTKIPPIGQMDPTACWAACLTWWLKAVYDVTKEQLEILDLFTNHGKVCNDDGQINPIILKDRITRNNGIFKMWTFTIMPTDLQSWLEDNKPLLIGFKTPKGNGHMNVLYGFDKNTSMVQAMEPWHPELKVNHSGNDLYLDPGARFTGKHETRQISHYQVPLDGTNGIFIGVPLPDPVQGVLTPVNNRGSGKLSVK